MACILSVLRRVEELAENWWHTVLVHCGMGAFILSHFFQFAMLDQLSLGIAIVIAIIAPE